MYYSIQSRRSLHIDFGRRQIAGVPQNMLVVLARMVNFSTRRGVVVGHTGSRSLIPKRIMHSRPRDDMLAQNFPVEHFPIRSAKLIFRLLCGFFSLPFHSTLSPFVTVERTLLEQLFTFDHRSILHYSRG